MSGSYMGTVERLEPEIAPIDVSAGTASIAVSLKRIADATPTLRDYFAGKAMQGIVAVLYQGIRPQDIPRMAEDCYGVADIMLAARARARP